MKNKKFGGAVIALFMAAIAMFSACADNADNGGKLTADTNVSDIQSEKVADEAAWKAAFARENYTNYSLKVVQNMQEIGEEWEIEYKYTPGKAFYSLQITADETSEDGKTTKKITREETYLVGTADSYSAWMIVYENGVKTNEGKDDNNDSEYEDMIDGGYVLMMTDGLTYDFPNVHYDETQKGYICNPAKGMTATIKILNGIFVGMIATYKYGETTTQSATMLIYDVGCTDITLPAALQNAKPTQDNQPTGFASLQGGEVTADEWKTVFSNFMTIENFTMYFEDGTNTYFYYADAPVIHIISSGKESYWYRKNSETWVYDMANPEWVSVMASTEPYSTFMHHMNPILRLFGSIYSQMTYDSTKKAYTAENITLDGTEIDYLEIKIAEGDLLGYLMEFGQTTYTCMLYNYGTTIVTLPQGVALPTE